MEKLMKFPMKNTLSILALCIGCTTAVFAQSSSRMTQQLESRFASANTTHDGKLTRDQATSGMPMVAKHFDEIDTQKVGYVTLQQIEEFMQQHRGTH
jgi:hypothetical protein